ncbi:MAG: Na+/H+ antiporter NhaC family protein [Acidobacteriota bacterium]|nr:Na+/H+ antiporter NhaC family protein [Acidobacteriota bacterium]
MTDPGLLVLLPALVTILAAVFTRRLPLALLLGILAGALVLGQGHLGPSAGFFWTSLKSGLIDVDKLKIVIFILLVGGLLEMIGASGAYAALAHRLSRGLTTPRKGRMAAWGLSAGLFFDDYANVLISGSAMRPVLDRLRVSPALLAYIVDVVAILASSAILSTWSAFESSELYRAAASVGREAPATLLFLRALPYHLYTFLAVALTLAVAWTGRWFGSRLDKRTFAARPDEDVEGEGARARHAVVPLAILVGGAFSSLIGTGIVFARRAGEPLSLGAILRHAYPIEGLIGATLAALIVGAVFLWRDGVLSHLHIRRSFHRGVLAMMEVSLIMLLATALSRQAGDLGTGTFLAGSIGPWLSPAVWPMMSFLLAAAITVATGFSWGAMSLVLPVAFSLGQAQPGLIPIMSGAVITGAVAGEHLIPYSEKAMMTGIACGIPPIYHIKTMLPQSLAGLAAASLGFLLLGLGFGLGIALAVPAVLLLAAHFALAKK